MVLEVEEIMVRKIAVGLWKVRTGIVRFGRVWVTVREREKSSEGSTEPHLGVTCVGISRRTRSRAYNQFFNFRTVIKHEGKGRRF